MKVKTVLFDIDDTLYDASLQIKNARLNAIRATIEAGLPVDIETGYQTLNKVVKEHGKYYNRHFNELLKKLGLKFDARVVAAGVVAYRETNLAFLKPYRDTIPTLLKLRVLGYELGVISDGPPVKQAQKLIQLGIQHFFDHVVISEEYEYKTITPKLFEICLQKFDAKPNEVVFIGNEVDKDVLSANQAGVMSVRIMKGESRIGEPKSPEAKPKYEITKLSEIFNILETIEKS